MTFLSFPPSHHSLWPSLNFHLFHDTFPVCSSLCVISLPFKFIIIYDLDQAIFFTSCIYSLNPYLTSTVGQALQQMLKLKSWKSQPCPGSLLFRCRKAHVLRSHQLYSELIPTGIEKEEHLPQPCPKAEVPLLGSTFLKNISLMRLKAHYSRVAQCCAHSESQQTMADWWAVYSFCSSVSLSCSIGIFISPFCNVWSLIWASNFRILKNKCMRVCIFMWEWCFQIIIQMYVSLQEIERSIQNSKAMGKKPAGYAWGMAPSAIQYLNSTWKKRCVHITGRVVGDNSS